MASTTAQCACYGRGAAHRRIRSYASAIGRPDRDDRIVAEAIVHDAAQLTIVFVASGSTHGPGRCRPTINSGISGP